MKTIKKITPEIEKKIFEAYKLGATDTEVCLEIGIDYDVLICWKATDENNKMVELVKRQPVWDAKKLFHKPQDFKEAESFLKRHPETKKDYSDRVEHTGKDGESIAPVLVQFIDAADNNKDTEGV